MKKQLLAAAVATAIAVPMAASADVTVYGQLHYSLDSIDLDSAVGVGVANQPQAMQGTGADGLALGYDGEGVNSHNSRFGIKGSEDLGNGLSLVFQMEFTISGESLDVGNTGGALANNRNTYVALAGSWGVAGIGQVDTPFKSSTGSLDLFNETVGDYEQLGFNDIRVPDAIFYMSPNWNGFSFVAGLVFPSEIVGAGAGNQADGMEAVSIAAMYSNGPWYASLAYEDISGEFVDSILAGANDTNDYDKWRLGLGYTANGWHVGFVYEDREIDNLAALGLVGITSDDSESWQLSASYTAGNNTFKIAYGEADEWGVTGIPTSAYRDLYSINDAEQWSIGVDHKMSNRTKVYAAYTDYSDDTANRDWDALSLGIVHQF